MIRLFSFSVWTLAIFFITGFISTMAFSDIGCPENLNLSVQIEPFLTSNRVGLEFSNLSGNHFQEWFHLNAGEDRDFTTGCSFSTLEPGQSISSGRFLQIRNGLHGKISVEVQGYTPNGKVYSIRSSFPDLILTGEIGAIVYAGPRTSRDILGRAVLQIFEVVQKNDRKI